MRECVAFDDVLLVPPSDEARIRSRRDPDTSTNIGGIDLDIPLIASPMDTVTEAEMAISLGELGGMGVIHRFMTPEEQARVIGAVVAFDTAPVVPAIGVIRSEMKRFDYLMDTWGDHIDMISIDIANGHHILMSEMVKYVKSRAPNLPIMAGNVATGEGYRFLAEDLGVDAVRVGIGGGSICKTRIQTGFGVPTLASVIDCYKMKQGRPNCTASIIADGGIKYPADLVKSLVAGADAIIAGSLFAGTKEAPGGIIYTNDGKAWKSYRGMASAEVQKDRRGGLKPGTVAEGVSMLTPYEGSLERVVNEFIGGLRSGMTYANAMTINELRSIEMIRITHSGVSESHAHGTRRR